VTERKNVVTFKGGPLTLVGETPPVGAKLPDFGARTGLAPDSAYGPRTDAGKVRILSVVPSLDTPVCSIQTKRFNQEAEKLGGVQVVTVSMDLPPAQQRWCGAEGVRRVKTVSDYYDGSFGKAMGLRIKELGLLARSVFVVDGEGTIRYAQIVPETTSEPDYAPVIEAARRLL
jgi:thiol peroxidase